MALKFLALCFALALGCAEPATLGPPPRTMTDREAKALSALEQARESEEFDDYAAVVRLWGNTRAASEARSEMAKIRLAGALRHLSKGNRAQAVLLAQEAAKLATLAGDADIRRAAKDLEQKASEEPESSTAPPLPAPTAEPVAAVPVQNAPPPPPPPDPGLCSDEGTFAPPSRPPLPKGLAGFSFGMTLAQANSLCHQSTGVEMVERPSSFRGMRAFYCLRGVPQTLGFSKEWAQLHMCSGTVCAIAVFAYKRDNPSWAATLIEVVRDISRKYGSESCQNEREIRWGWPGQAGLLGGIIVADAEGNNVRVTYRNEAYVKISSKAWDSRL